MESEHNRVYGDVRRVQDLPCPPRLPILGNLHQLPLTAVHRALEQWAEELGSPYRISLMGQALVVWNDTRVCHAVMRERPFRYRRAANLQAVFAEVGADGVFFAEGDDWLFQRKWVVEALSAPNIRHGYPALRRVTEHFRARLHRLASEEKPVEITSELTRYALGMMRVLVFGDGIDVYDEDMIFVSLARIFPAMQRRVLAPFPYWHYLPVRDQRLDDAVKEIHRTIHTMIRKAKERTSVRVDGPRDLLETMLTWRDPSGSGLTDEQIVANVLTLFLAGEDTTAYTLAWAIHELVTRDGMQRRLMAEADAVLGSESVCPTYEALDELALFEAVCTEAARFHPVIPTHVVEPLEDVQVDGVLVPVGTRMVFLNRPSTLDAGHFACPHDFRPERWIEGGKAGFQPHAPKAFMQFGSGPRVCPGRHLASVEMRMALSMLAKHFHMELAVPADAVREVCAITLRPSTLPLRLRSRT